VTLFSRIASGSDISFYSANKKHEKPENQKWKIDKSKIRNYLKVHKLKSRFQKSQSKGLA
jgi:hypothetical protein